MESDEKYFIKSSSHSFSGKTKVLKQGDTFAFFDFSGDINQIGVGNQGLYHKGTRFLNQWVLTLENAHPCFLSSHTTDNNELLKVDLNNPAFPDSDGNIIRQGTVHILRDKFLIAGVAYEKITIHNFNLIPIGVDFKMKFDSDYADIFEIRGESRSKKGKIRRPKCEGDKMLLSYEGLDQIERRTRIHFQPSPNILFENEMKHHLKLASKESFNMYTSISCEIKKEIPKVYSFQNAWKKRTKYNAEIRNNPVRIKTSNNQFNGLLNRSAHDIKTMLTETKYGAFPYAGIPWFNAPFGRDALITAIECLWIQPLIAKGTLKYLAAHQAIQVDVYKDAEPGKILHEKRDGEMANLHEIPFQKYYGTVDATILFICLAGKYLERTADLNTIKEIWPNLLKAMNWIDQYGDDDGDGFVEYEKKSSEGLINQGWKDSADAIFFENGDIAEGKIALCEVQGYTYSAKIEAAKMANILQRDDLAESWEKEAEELKQKFNDKFWSESKETFFLALDNDKYPCDVVSSNAGQCLFTGIVDEAKAKKVAKTLLSDQMFSGWGIRTLSTQEKRYNPMSYHNGSVWPHDNALIALGLSEFGLQKEVGKVVDGMFKTSIYENYQRLPELFSGFKKRKGVGPTAYPVACSPQSWAVGSVFLLVQALLGLHIDAKSRTLHFNYPQLPKYMDYLLIEDLTVVDDTKVSFKIVREKGKVEVKMISENSTVQIKITGSSN